MAFINDGKIGIDVTVVGSNADFTPGTIAHGTDGDIWLYALAAEAVTAYSFGVVDNANQFLNSTDARVKAGVGKRLAIAGATTFTASQYGWFLTNGVHRVRTAGATLPNVPLYTCDTETGATSGCLDNSTNSGSAVEIFGIMVTATGSTTGSAAPCVVGNLVARWPA